VSDRNAFVHCKSCTRYRRGYGRGLCGSCYHRHDRKGTLDQYPTVLGQAEPWQPAGSHGERMVERYQRLASITPRLSLKRMAFELGVSVRQVQRYEQAVRLQAGEAA
jgi:hypothetical protein